MQMGRGSDFDGQRHIFLSRGTNCGWARAVSCSAQEKQFWKIILREILNLSLNAKFCISKNMAPFLYVFRTGPCF